MKVKLLTHTGQGRRGMDYAARLLVYVKNTRLEQGGETRHKVFVEMTDSEIRDALKEVAMTVRSSWEFVDYTFEITGVSRAFTHQFVRTRTISFAQQSQRSVDVGDFAFVIPEEKVDKPGCDLFKEYMQRCAYVYRMLRDRGWPAQDARGILPTNICTNIIAKINLRTMADLVGKRDNPRAQGEYTNVVKLMVEEILEVHPWTKDFLYPERSATPALDDILKKALGSASPVDQPHINKALKELDMLKEIWG